MPAKKIPREDLLDELRRLADELGRTPGRDDVQDHSPHSPTTYYRRFGSYREACEEAGLEPNGHAPVSEEELIRALQDLADELGRTPTRREMNEMGEFGATSYWRVFGGYADACEAAGLTPNDPGARTAQRVQDAIGDVITGLDDPGPSP